MLRKKQEQINFWFSYIEELERACSIFDLKNLLQLHARTLLGFTRKEMVDEAIASLKELDKMGLIKIIKVHKEELNDHGVLFNNIDFEFKDGFTNYKKQKVRKIKFKKFREDSEYWIIVAAAIAAVISLVIQIIK